MLPVLRDLTEMDLTTSTKLFLRFLTNVWAPNSEAQELLQEPGTDEAYKLREGNSLKKII